MQASVLSFFVDWSHKPNSLFGCFAQVKPFQFTMFLISLTIRLFHPWTRSGSAGIFYFALLTNCAQLCYTLWEINRIDCPDTVRFPKHVVLPFIGKTFLRKERKMQHMKATMIETPLANAFAIRVSSVVRSDLAVISLEHMFSRLL